MKKIVLTLFFLVMLSKAAYAKDYIVKLKQSEITLFSENDNARKITKDTYVLDELTAKELQKAERTEFICEDVPIELYGESYDDTYYSYQQYEPLMDIPYLRENISKGKGIKVAVIDSGCYSEHPDLEGADIRQGYNYVAENEDTSDTNGHGTNVMGILTAASSNGIGISGIATEATYFPLVVYYNGQGNASHMLKAIYDAVDVYQCDIVNMSLGVEPKSESLIQLITEAVDHASSKGVTIVAAVGNGGGTETVYPAGIDGVIGVGAVNTDMTKASYSRYNSTVDVVTTGKTFSLTNSSNYRSWQGTSEAAPVITGTLTALMGKYGKIDCHAAIKALSADIDSIGKDINTGYGFFMPCEAETFYKNAPVFISPIKVGDNNASSVKLFSSAVSEGALIFSKFKNDVFSDYDIKYIIFDNDLSYVNYDINNTEYDVNSFVIENIDSMKSLSYSKKF